MRKILLAIILTLACATGFAQGQGHRPGGQGHRPNFEKFTEDRISFVTRFMQLSEADSIKFVPVYKEMLKEKGELMFKYHKTRIRPNQQYDDATYTEVAMNEADYKIEDAKCDKKYLEKFQKILTAKQVYSYTVAERMFVGQFMGHGGQRPQGQRPQGQYPHGQRPNGTAPAQPGK